MFELDQDLKNKHLPIDTINTKGLEYCLLSYCASKTPQRIESDDHVAMKLRGAFSSVDDAMAHARRLDGSVHTYIAELYKWILIGNLDDSMYEDGSTPEHHLVDMIRCHKQRNADAREQFQQRKEKVMKEGLDAVDDDLPPPPPPEKKDHKKDKKTLVIEPIRAQDDEGQHRPTLADTDTVTVPGLNYAVISVVERDPELQDLKTPQGVVGLKIRGIFETRDEAEDHMKKLGKTDADFDMFLAELYRFHMLPPDLDKTEKIEYRDDYLNKLFSGYNESQMEAKAFQAERDAIDGVQKLVHPAEIKAAEDQADEAGTSS